VSRILAMSNYYLSLISGKRLRRCYEIAPMRIRQYLHEEINFVKNFVTKETVLELGCGFGRIFPFLHNKVKKIVGIDASADNINLARKLYGNLPNVHFGKMDVQNLTFPDNSFDVILAIQNGLSSFKVDNYKLIIDCVRIIKDQGKIILSSYSDKIWEDRLYWFELHAREGLIGSIDYDLTKNGEIVCKDGFRADTMSENDFKALLKDFEYDFQIIEVDNSSLFCIIDVSK
jgi:2-polyprenyl-6-hydroxyphenyl methylase/3-demethylubiquinone-9 3-methyltransferase